MGCLQTGGAPFWKHRGRADHILALDTEIRGRFSPKKHFGAIFFDIEAAYDTILRNKILRKQQLLLPRPYRLIYKKKNILSNRWFSFSSYPLR